MRPFAALLCPFNNNFSVRALTYFNTYIFLYFFYLYSAPLFHWLSADIYSISLILFFFCDRRHIYQNFFHAHYFYCIKRTHQYTGPIYSFSEADKRHNLIFFTLSGNCLQQFFINKSETYKIRGT